MTITTLEERINNAKAKIEKKASTITKKQALIIKKLAEAEKLEKSADELDQHKARMRRGDVEYLRYDIERAEREIAETQASLAKYEAMLAGEIAKESTIAKDVPECLKQLQADLAREWEAYDKERRDYIRKAKRELTYEEYVKKFSKTERMVTCYLTDDQIKKNAERDARELVLNLYNRIKDITGEVTDWRGIHATIGTWGGTVLNGIVLGKEGRCRVESIFAGGYNIQRLHVRVLTHAF